MNIEKCKIQHTNSIIIGKRKRLIRRYDCPWNFPKLLEVKDFLKEHYSYNCLH
jgi:hypothetical protein